MADSKDNIEKKASKALKNYLESYSPDDVKKLQEVKITKILNRYHYAASDRLWFERQWDIISRYVYINRGYFLVTHYPGYNQSRWLFNSTAVQSNLNLASVIQGNLTNPNSKWFALELDDEIDETTEEKDFLFQATNKVLNVFNSSAGGFQLHNHEFLMSLTALGSSCMFVEDDLDKEIQFFSPHLSQIYIQENRWGFVDTVFRKFKMSIRQMIQQWGEEKVGNEVMKMAEANIDDEIEILHHVCPVESSGEEYSAEKSTMKFHSCYINLNHKKLLDEGGYNELPYIFTRWYRMQGEKYGRSPAWDCLADIRMVNTMQREYIRSVELAGSPPLLTADDGVLGTVRIQPNVVINGAINNMTGQAKIQPLQLGNNIQDLLANIQATEERIKNAFFDKLLINQAQGPQMTATEVQQKAQERMELLAPQIGRIQSEYLNPIVKRVFNILLRKRNPKKPGESVLGRVPVSLKGKGIKVRYLSPLAKMTKMEDVRSVTGLGQDIAPFIQIYPTMMDWINPDKFMKAAMDARGVPPTIEQSQQDVDKMRKQRQEHQNMQQNMQMAQAQQQALQGGKTPQ